MRPVLERRPFTEKRITDLPGNRQRLKGSGSVPLAGPRIPGPRNSSMPGMRIGIPWDSEDLPTLEA